MSVNQKQPADLCVCGHPKDEHHNVVRFCCEIPGAGQYCIENEDCGCDSYRPAEPTKGEPSMVEENPMITRTLENIEALPKNGAIFVDAGGRAQIATAITTFTLQALAVAYRQQATDLAAALERVKELEK